MRAQLFIQLFYLAVVLLTQNYAIAQEQDTLVRDSERYNYQRQTERNQIFVGADFGLGFGFRNTDLSVNNSTVLLDATLTPKIGFYIKDRWQMGILIDNFASIASFDYESEYFLYYYSVAFYTRYYVKGGLFGEVSLGTGNGFEQFINSDLVEVENGFSTNKYSAGIGVGNFWMKRLSFELLLKYNWATNTFNESNEKFHISGLTVTAGVGIAIGKMKD